MIRIFICLYFLISLLVVNGQSLSTPVSTHIHIDQFGYLPGSEKVAVLSDPYVGFNSSESYSPPASLSVIDAVTLTSMGSFNPSVWNSGMTQAESGDKGWWLDFSTINATGAYFLYDAVNNRRSHVFDIKPDIYNSILKSVGRMFFYNRCNFPKEAPFAEPKWVDSDNNFLNAGQDSQCRYVFNQGNNALVKDLSGGWFDAGDYNKYMTFAAKPVHELLTAYEFNPLVFGDNWNIPESGNGLPDILDELKWELDWMKKMQYADGSVIQKMGSIDYNHNKYAPPSNNFDPRYYGPTCTSATIALAGMFAHASYVFKDVPSLAAEAEILKAKAIISWNQVLPKINGNTLETGCDNGTIKAGDADWSVAKQKEDALLAAFYLFLITNDVAYHTYFKTKIADSEVINNNWMGTSNMPLHKVLMHYTTESIADNTTKNEILNSIRPHIQGDWDGFYRFNTKDLYRSEMPGWAYHWGSNQQKANFANLAMMVKRYNIDAGNNAQFQRKLAEQVHYFHGVNPMNLVYLTNMYALGGDQCANEMYHTWFNEGTIYDHALTSPNGPAPGYVTGGPNKDYSYAPLSPPSGQPAMKAYLDFNTSSPQNSWEITEPAIYYQSAYIMMLANFATENSVLPIRYANFHVEKQADDVHISCEINNVGDLDSVFLERSAHPELSWNTISGFAKTALNDGKFIYSDIKPWAQESKLYYRLRFKDNNGEINHTESKVVEKSLTPIETISNNSVKISPNPVAESIHLELIDVQNVISNIAIYLLDGKMVKQFNTEKTWLDVSELVPGVYMLNIQFLGAKTTSLQFVKM